MSDELRVWALAEIKSAGEGEVRRRLKLPPGSHYNKDKTSHLLQAIEEIDRANANADRSAELNFLERATNAAEASAASASHANKISYAALTIAIITATISAMLWLVDFTAQGG